MARKMIPIKKCRYIVGIDEVGRGPLAGPVTVSAFCIDTHRISVKKLVDELNLVLQTQGQKRRGTKNIKHTVFDSKSITEHMRENISQFIHVNLASKHKDTFGFGVYVAIKSKTASQIDAKGIAVCIKDLVSEVLIDICKQIKQAQQIQGIESVGREQRKGAQQNNVSNSSQATVNHEQVEILLDGGLKAPTQYMYQKTIITGDAKEPVIGIASIIAKVHRDTYMKKISKKYPGYGFEVHKGYGTKHHLRAIESSGTSRLHRKTFLTKRYSGLK